MLHSGKGLHENVSWHHGCQLMLDSQVECCLLLIGDCYQALVVVVDYDQDGFVNAKAHKELADVDGLLGGFGD